MVPQEICIITYSVSKHIPAVFVTSESYTGHWILSKSDFSLDIPSYPLLSDTDDLSIFKVQNRKDTENHKEGEKTQ